MKTTGLIWFKNDLRLHDNEAFNAAVENCDQIMPVFIVDPRWSQGTIHGFKKTGLCRLRFIYESVLALQSKLRSLGSELYIYVGMPEKLIPQLIIKHKISSVYTKLEFGPDERIVDTKIATLSNMFRVSLHKFNTYSSLKEEALSNIGEEVFDVFIKKALDSNNFRPVFSTPENLNTLNILGDFDIANFKENFDYNEAENFDFKGGEQEALLRLNNLIWETNNINTLKNDKHFSAANSYTTKLSPYLSQGCISANLILQELNTYEAKNGFTEGLQVMRRDLLWREYYFAMFMKFGTKFFRQGGVFKKDMICLPNYEALNLWIQGKTGEEIVDANMKELALTGFINCMGRKIVANYLSKKMLVDWRLGAAYFESQLIDYDVCLNYGNWTSAIGVGPNKNENPTYNPQEVAQQYDNSGEFRKKWLR